MERTYVGSKLGLDILLHLELGLRPLKQPFQFVADHAVRHLIGLTFFESMLVLPIYVHLHMLGEA